VPEFRRVADCADSLNARIAKQQGIHFRLIVLHQSNSNRPPWVIVPCLTSPMDSSRITPAQAEQVRRRVKRDLDYVTALVGRMRTLNFPEDDSLWRSGLRAQKALTELHCVLNGRTRRGE
jgi:hypothetical protein